MAEILIEEREETISEFQKYLLTSENHAYVNEEYIEFSGEIPSGRGGMSNVEHQGRLYVFGGHRYVGECSEISEGWNFAIINGYQYFNDFFEFDFLTLESKLLTNKNKNDGPTPRFGHTAVKYDNKMFVFGGYTPFYDKKNNLVKNEKAKASLLSSKNSIETVVNTSNELFAFDFGKKMWFVGPKAAGKFAYERGKQVSVPMGRVYHTSSVVNNKMFVFGGLCFGKLTYDIFSFNFSSFEWDLDLKVSGKPPCGRYGHTATVVDDNYIVIFGGSTLTSSFFNTNDLKVSDEQKMKLVISNINNWYLNDTYIFSVREMCWTNLHIKIRGKVPVARAFHTACLINYITSCEEKKETVGEKYVIIYGGWTNGRKAVREANQLRETVRTSGSTVLRQIFDKNHELLIPSKLENFVNIEKDSMLIRSDEQIRVFHWNSLTYKNSVFFPSFAINSLGFVIENLQGMGMDKNRKKDSRNAYLGDTLYVPMKYGHICAQHKDDLILFGGWDGKFALNVAQKCTFIVS